MWSVEPRPETGFIDRRLEWRSRESATLRDQDDADAEQDGDICDVEDAGSQRPPADVHEIDDVARERVIHPVRGASGQKKTESEQGPSGPVQSHRRANQDE